MYLVWSIGYHAHTVTNATDRFGGASIEATGHSTVATVCLKLLTTACSALQSGENHMLHGGFLSGTYWAGSRLFLCLGCGLIIILKPLQLVSEPLQAIGSWGFWYVYQ